MKLKLLALFLTIIPTFAVFAAMEDLPPEVGGSATSWTSGINTNNDGSEGRRGVKPVSAMHIQNGTVTWMEITTLYCNDPLGRADPLCADRRAFSDAKQAFCTANPRNSDCQYLNSLITK